MIGKLLVSASFVALLAVTPAAAQEQGQGQGGQNNSVIMKKQQGQSQGQAAGEAAPAKQQPDQVQATDDQGQANQTNKKKVQQSQDATGEQPATEAQATGQEDQPANKKKDQQNNQAEQGGTAQDQKNQNAQQDGQDSDQMTTGATGRADADIPVEKRTVIREKIITRDVPRVERDKIDFDINVGVAIPGTIALQPLPPDIIEVVPAYQGYQYFVLADGTIIIVDPGTLQIVYVLAG
jgi:hypothetical protein